MGRNGRDEPDRRVPLLAGRWARDDQPARRQDRQRDLGGRPHRLARHGRLRGRQGGRRRPDAEPRRRVGEVRDHRQRGGAGPRQDRGRARGVEDGGDDRPGRARCAAPAPGPARGDRVGRRLRGVGPGQFHDGRDGLRERGPARGQPRGHQMKVAFGVSLSPGTPLLQEKDTRRFIDLAKMADDYGAEAVGTHDTAFIGGDAYVRATLIALGASRARVGLRPTNPLTREPQVMASFLASIDSLTGGRAFMDMASGDSAVYNIGYKPASRARIADYIACVRGLLATGEASYQGRPQRVRWAATVVRPRIPISICAEGPRMLELAGRIGDGVIAGTGLLPEIIRDTLARVHAGAREAARNPADVDVW